MLCGVVQTAGDDIDHGVSCLAAVSCSAESCKEMSPRRWPGTAAQAQRSSRSSIVMYFTCTQEAVLPASLAERMKTSWQSGSYCTRSTWRPQTSRPSGAEGGRRNQHLYLAPKAPDGA